MDRLKKKYGNESIQQYGEMGNKNSIERFSSGSLLFDKALGGGWPRGRVIELIGQESSGKTSLTLQAIAVLQKLKENVVFIDMEHALDANWAKTLGVDMDTIFLSTPDCAEDALEIIIAVAEASDIALIILDSVSALVPRAEIEGIIGDAHMGLQARLMSQTLRKLAGIAAKNNTTIMFINQIRHKIGVVFGSPETTSGGLALKFYASIRVKCKRGKDIIEDGNIVGNKLELYTMKNKTAIPHQKVELEFYYSKGISVEGEITQAMLDSSLILKESAMYTIPNMLDFERFIKEESKLKTLKDVIVAYPDEDRQKVSGYANVCKAFRQNINFQKLGFELLKNRGIL